jgi:hypothetical protein
VDVHLAIAVAALVISAASFIAAVVLWHRIARIHANTTHLMTGHLHHVHNDDLHNQKEA